MAADVLRAEVLCGDVVAHFVSGQSTRWARHAEVVQGHVRRHQRSLEGINCLQTRDVARGPHALPLGVALAAERSQERLAPPQPLGLLSAVSGSSQLDVDTAMPIAELLPPLRIPSLDSTSANHINILILAHAHTTKL